MFDKDKFYIGKLCKRRHEYLDSGGSLWDLRGACVQCKKERWKHLADNLNPKYIKNLMYSQPDIKGSEITPEMIELKRDQFEMRRILKTIKQQTMTMDHAPSIYTYTIRIYKKLRVKLIEQAKKLGVQPREYIVRSLTEKLLK